MSIDKAVAAFRFGMGPMAGRLPARAPADQLRRPDLAVQRHPAASSAEILSWHEAARTRVRELGPGTPAARQAQREGFDIAGRQTMLHLRIELARAVDAEDCYRERLVRFWADHFTVRARARPYRPMVTSFVDEAIRPHLTAPFAQMLRAAVLHPAMLLYLDQTGSVGPESVFGQRRGAGLNENLARELLELHTLGVAGGYDQTDVRQLALLLTGLGVSASEGTTFTDRRAQPGAETVLGRRYGSNAPARIEDIHALLDDLAVHPDTARHLGTKLAVHFVSDNPDPGLIADLAALWQSSGGDLGKVSTALATHPAALRPELQKARQPFDFVVAACRALGIGGQALMDLPERDLRRGFLLPMAIMGQRWQEPGGPDGWEEALTHWITPQGLAARIDWAMQMPVRLRRDLPDARDFVDIALAGFATEDLRRLVGRAERNAEGVGLVLAAPQFNRR